MLSTEIPATCGGDFAKDRILCGSRSTRGSPSDDPNGRKGSATAPRRGPTGRVILDGHGPFRNLYRQTTGANAIPRVACRILCDRCAFPPRRAMAGVRGGVGPSMFRRGQVGCEDEAMDCKPCPVLLHGECKALIRARHVRLETARMSEVAGMPQVRVGGNCGASLGTWRKWAVPDPGW